MTADVIVFSIWLLYVLIKDVVGPLVRYVVKRNQPEESSSALPLSVSDVKTKFAVFELDLSTLKTQIVDFKQLLQEHREEQEKSSIALDNKIDMVLEELKQIGNRLTAVETIVEHVLNKKIRHTEAM